MSSRVTNDSKDGDKSLEDVMPDRAVGRTRFSNLTDEEREAKFREILGEDVTGGKSGISSNRNITKENESSIVTDETIQTEERNNTADSVQTELTDGTHSTISKRISGKQRKESLEDYRQAFLTAPKIDDRKPVFISREVRDSLDEIARKLGSRGMSVSGFVENLVRHHLDIYREDVEVWKKL
jgi:hypothetical protein